MRKGFSQKPRYTFGVLTTVAKDPFRSRYHAELLSGIFRRLAASGHGLKIFAPPLRPYRSLDEILRGQDLDGLLVLTWRWIHPEVARLIETARHERVLVFNDPVPGLRVNHVYTDVAAGMAQAVAHLLKKKYRRIGMLRGPAEIPFRTGKKTVRVPFIDTRLKEHGFIRALKAKGISCDRRWIRAGKANSEAEGHRVMKQWLREKKLPEAIVCGNDDLAFGALAALRRTGRKIAVIGFDDLERAKSFSPPLTTVRQPLVRMGMDAAGILIRQRETSAPEILSRRYLPKLIVRKSA